MTVHPPTDDSETRSWAGDYDPLADPEDRRVLFAALDSFRQYRRTAHANTTHRRRQAFYALPPAHLQLLSEPPFSLLDSFTRVDEAIDVNADIADAILATGLASFELEGSSDSTDASRKWRETATSSDVNKAYSTIRQFYRDWSAEGAVERDICYGPVLRDLKEEFAKENATEEEIKVLVPGAGLGRLVFEVCRAGFAAEGNEISYHQLLASSWILNHTSGPQQHTLYPFALQFSNLQSREQQLQTVQIPDIHPGAAMYESLQEGGHFGTMSMSAADFVVLYSSPSNKEQYDAVATVFFIDTAPNLIRYVETIHHCLKSNGLWVNVGPLLWHFEDVDHRANQPSKSEGEPQGIEEPGRVELTEAEVFALIERMGFVIEKRQPEDERPLCGYIQDPRSMRQSLYRPSHWTARKK
ncbi:putative trehalase [Aspergillus campestris IBT 28561]|uniref:carnosine N-methyltransferase n=1 Tax=Aspergillus campestris (strain IBT 28561) TaxID=1392248 RepID=A0A2I1D835_ASPC2|nr:putative trehalase [Aspergillus campestris IBT 28561]PKY06029.1 putative trehalase [Aspergillus campestris IBT 28561]